MTSKRHARPQRRQPNLGPSHLHGALVGYRGRVHRAPADPNQLAKFLVDLVTAPAR